MPSPYVVIWVFFGQEFVVFSWLFDSVILRRVDKINRICNCIFLMLTFLIRNLKIDNCQETIDSGQVDDELENIRVVLNDVVLMAKETAVVTWETQGPNEDAYIQEVLTR